MNLQGTGNEIQLHREELNILKRYWAISYTSANGKNPISRVTVDAARTIYGITNMDGTYGYGLVFEITQ